MFLPALPPPAHGEGRNPRQPRQEIRPHLLRKWARFAWGNFVTLTGDNLFNAVRDAIESLHELPGLTDTGRLLFGRATLKIYDRPTLRAIIQGIHGMDSAAHDGHDFKGDMYEYLLSKLAASGTNGQFRSPRHIIGLIVALVNRQPGQRICDPAYGTYPGILFDIIFANPPFSGKIQDESILADLNYNLNTRATELLFLKWIVDHLAPGGRAGVIVPNGVLFGSTNAATALRELLLTECDLQAVISLPSGVFKPYAGVATAALIFQKGTPTQSVWFYDITADGFSLDDKRTPIEASDLRDVLAKWPAREEGPNSYRVPIEKIRENAWSLAAGRYKPVTTEA
ncbi:MAG: N-6 DNA methylase, partial [Chthoniobacteraceae bacterium]